MNSYDNYESRLDMTFFTLPDIYKDEEEQDEMLKHEAQTVLCKLFIDCFMILNFEEYSAIQGVLIMQKCWDSSPLPPVDIGGLSHTYIDVPLTLSAMAKILETDKAKLISVLKSAFAKLPILKTMFPIQFVKEIERSQLAMDIEEEARPDANFSRERLKEIGYIIRKNYTRIYRDNLKKYILKKESGK